MIIPSFAVGRTQTLLYLMRDLKLRGAIPDLPVFVDSRWRSMSRKCFAVTSRILTKRPKRCFGNRADARFYVQSWNSFIPAKNLRRSMTCGFRPSSCPQVEWSRAEEITPFEIPVAGTQKHDSVCGISGGWNPRAVDEGWRPADQDPRRNDTGACADTHDGGFFGRRGFAGDPALAETFKEAPKQTFIVHGEPESSRALAEVHHSLGWKTHIPQHLETVKL